MQMLKIIQISADVDIRSTFIRNGQDVDFLIFTDADIYFQYLRMQQMLKIIRISADAMLKIRWIFGPPLIKPSCVSRKLTGRKKKKKKKRLLTV